MANYELLALNEATPQAVAPTSADTGVVTNLSVTDTATIDTISITTEGSLGGNSLATLKNTNPLRQAVRVAMTAAASGSNGIQVLDNTDGDFGTGDFSLARKIFVASTRPSANQILSQKHDGTNGRIVTLLTTGVIRLTINATNYDSTVALTSASNVVLDLLIVVVRETASVAGSVTFYNQGVIVGTAVTITAGAPVTVDNAVSEYILGTSAVRTAGDFYRSINYNMTLSSTDALMLAIHGPSRSQFNASNTAVYTSDFSAGADSWTPGGSQSITGNTDGINGQNDWAAILRTSGTGALSASRAITSASGRKRTTVRIFNPSGSPITHIRVAILADLSVTADAVIAVPANTQVDTDLKFSITAENSSLVLAACDAAGTLANVPASTVIYFKNYVRYNLGITTLHDAADAQSNTGQILDSSGNKQHAMLPEAGATVIGRPTSQPQQVRWTNSWSETAELQYIGGTNQAILPAKAYIESIVGVITSSGGSGVQDIIIGDGSVTDRYVTITTGLAAGTTTFTLANRTTDGTNLKLTVDPDATCRMSISWTITFRTLE